MVTKAMIRGPDRSLGSWEEFVRCPGSAGLATQTSGTSARPIQSHLLSCRKPQCYIYCIPPCLFPVYLYSTMAPSLLSILCIAFTLFLSYLFYRLVFLPLQNPLHELAGPPVRKLLSNHLSGVLEYVLKTMLMVQLNNDFSPVISPRVHELYTQRYGRSIRIRGVGPVSVHVYSKGFGLIL